MLLSNRITLVLVLIFCLAAAGLAGAYATVRGLYLDEHRQNVLAGLQANWEKQVLEYGFALETAARQLDLGALGLAAADRSPQLASLVAAHEEGLHAAGITRIQVVDPSGDPVFSDAPIEDGLLLPVEDGAFDDLGRGVSREVVRLGSERLLVVAMILRSANEPVGALVLGAPLAPAVEAFRAATGAHVTVRAGREPEDPELRLDHGESEAHELAVLPLGRSSGDRLEVRRDVSLREARLRHAELLGAAAVLGYLAFLLLVGRGMIVRALRPLDDCIAVMDGLAVGDAAGTVLALGAVGEVQGLVQAVERLRRAAVDRDLAEAVRQHRENRAQSSQAAASST